MRRSSFQRWSEQDVRLCSAIREGPAAPRSKLKTREVVQSQRPQGSRQETGAERPSTRGRALFFDRPSFSTSYTDARREREGRSTCWLLDPTQSSSEECLSIDAESSMTRLRKPHRLALI